jgi:hypothetical protein
VIRIGNKTNTGRIRAIILLENWTFETPGC